VDRDSPGHQPRSDYGSQVLRVHHLSVWSTNNIITDNGTNFTSGEFQDFSKELGIKIKYASVAHPKSNG
jgi:transposase InsO family protein